MSKHIDLDNGWALHFPLVLRDYSSDIAKSGTVDVTVPHAAEVAIHAVER